MECSRLAELPDSIGELKATALYLNERSSLVALRVIAGLDELTRLDLSTAHQVTFPPLHLPA